MIIHYSESMAMVPQAKPRQGHISLDDHHKTAWRLYSQGAPDLQDGDTRAFLFRVEPHPTLPMDIYLLRTPGSFAGSKARCVDLSEGQRLSLSWLHLPSSSQRSTEPGSGPAAGASRGKRYQPPFDAWPENCLNKIRRHGFDVEGKIAVHQHGVFRLPGRGGRKIGVAHCAANVVVTDPVRAAEAWLQGVSRKRGYGMGLLIPTKHGER